MVPAMRVRHADGAAGVPRVRAPHEIPPPPRPESNVLFMNEWEINQARDRYRNHPVLRKATQFLSDYRDQVNAHSDGWPYWSVAVHAARQLIALIQHPDTATDQAFRKSLAPIQSFYT